MGCKISKKIYAPSLPHTIKDYKYSSYVIDTTGSVELDGVSVDEGVYTFGGKPADKVQGVTITGTGSVVIIAQDIANE